MAELRRESGELLSQRWAALMALPSELRGAAFDEAPDRQISANYKALNGSLRLPSIASLPADAPHPPIVRYGWRSLDRAWLIQDNRLAARLRPPLWAADSGQQVFITSLLTGVLSAGPAVMASAYVPDLHHFRGSIGGKDVIPLWRDAAGTLPNLPAGLLDRLTALLAAPVAAQDLFAYTYGVLSAPAYVADFAEELSLPPPRLPITTDAALFADVTALGRRLLWLHTYGERFVPVGQVPGRMPTGRARSIKGIGAAGHACPEDFDWQPDSATPHDGVLRVGDGELGPVSRAVWDFSVSGNKVLQSWLAFRMRKRSGKKSSPLDDIRPAHWDVELSRELRELIWVLEATVDTQADQNALLRRIVSGPVLRQDQLPQPTPSERLPPGEDDDAQAQLL